MQTRTYRSRNPGSRPPQQGRVFAHLAGGLLLPAAAGAADDLPIMTKYDVGESVPYFEAKDKTGTLFSMEKAVAERPVLLVFWSIF